LRWGHGSNLWKIFDKQWHEKKIKTKVGKRNGEQTHVGWAGKGIAWETYVRNLKGREKGSASKREKKNKIN